MATYKEPSYRCCTTVLGSKTKLKGTIKFSSSLQIEGNFDGVIDSEGFLGIGEHSNVRATVKAKSASIAGRLLGDVQVTDKLELYSTAVVHGNVSASQIRFQDGMELVGDCDMLRNPGNIDIFSAETDKLKANLLK